jgi:hypothetical protein
MVMKRSASTRQTLTLGALGFQPYDPLGFPNGDRNESPFNAVHVNAINGGELSPGDPLTDVQALTDVGNLNSGLLGTILHGVVDNGIGRVFFPHSNNLDPGRSK